MLLPGVTIALTGVAGKLGTAWLVTRGQSPTRAGWLRAGVLLTPRGEFSIVIAGLAVAAGAPPRLSALVAVEVLLLATLAPFAAQLLQRHDERIMCARRHGPCRDLAA